MTSENGAATGLVVTGLGIRVGDRSLVDDVSFAVAPGRRVCLLGESGSGKSLTAAAVLGRLPQNMVATGSVRVNGIEVLGTPTLERPAAARVAMVFQDSAVALNPLVRVRDQLVTPLRRRHGLAKRVAEAAATELAESVGLPDPVRMVDALPSQLSGGQRQRVCIALALACNTSVLVADEPTTALDVVSQARVLEVLRRYTAGDKTPSLLFITHDLAVASELCDDAVILGSGRVVESGPLTDVIARPNDEYTRALVSAARATSIAPSLGRARGDVERSAASGTLLDTGAEPSGTDPDPLAQTGASPPAPFFDVRRVSRAFMTRRSRPFAPSDRRVALHDTSLTIHASERVGIVGVSGSGKTTLLRVLLGLETSDTGTVMCTGRRVRPADVRHLRWYRRLVQYVPQDPASTLDPWRAVRELVAEPLVRLDVEGDRDASVRDALQAVGIGADLLDRRVHELSGGQAQRVALARAIVTRPAFLLADEPVSGLDLPLREQVVDLLTQIARERCTGLLVVSHDLSMVAGLCERTLVMHDGAVVEDRRTAELLADPRHERTRELLAAIPSVAA